MRAARRPGAMGSGLALLLGVLAVQWLPRLPPVGCSIAVVLLALAAMWRWPRARLLAWLLLGIGWAMWRGALAMDLRLPRPLEGRDFVVTGAVSRLPEHDADAARFAFTVDHATLDGAPQALHGRVQLSWYTHPPPLPPCSRWQLRVRLKRPRGLANPGGTDSERSALERRIAAHGYVRKEGPNRMLAAGGPCLDRWRDAIARRIAAQVANPHDAALLRALAVGDTRGLSQHDWKVARANGVSHLLAISGFHIGVAAVFGVALVRLLYWLWPRLALRWPRLPVQAMAALAVALVYGALAGFGLPTVRTLLMIAVVALARCSRRSIGGGQTLALAMLAILLVDPLSVLSAGFWLSFVAVAFLMLCLSLRPRGLRGFVHELTAAQAVMTVSLLPLTLWFFGEASLVGAVSNLVAVPLVSLVIVPCTLLGMLLLPCPWAAGPVLRLAGHVAHAQWWLLERTADWPGAHGYLPAVQPWALVLATVGALWLFAPRGLPLRGLGLVLFLPLLFPTFRPMAVGSYRAWVLDVGQGLALVVRTAHHAMVYDTGAAYPSGYNLGEAAVVPSLHALGIRRLDLLMISHADNDHAGGARAVAGAFPDGRRLAGEPGRMHLPMAQCLAGQAWRWDGVDFKVLWPNAASMPAKGNDRSCVLLVSGPGGRLLLSGDISQRVEPAVAAALGPGPQLVLVVPHHGSHSSSSEPFIRALHPVLGLVSAGWRSRFGHPHPDVVARYRDAGVPLLNTADRGAIELDTARARSGRVRTTWRQWHPRYWRE